MRLHFVGNFEGAAEDEVQVVEPVRAVHVGQPLGVVNHGEAGVAHLPEALAHHVNVVYVEEVQLGTRVYVFALVAAAVDDVHHGVHLRPRVHDEDAVGLRVGVHHGLHVVLVGTRTVRGDADQRLRASAQQYVVIGWDLGSRDGIQSFSPGDKRLLRI